MNTDHDPIDDLLAELRADVPKMTDRAFAVARTHLSLVIEPVPPAEAPAGPVPVVQHGRPRLMRSPPRRWPRLVASAAAVVALAAGVLVVRTGFDDNTPVASAAAAQLNSAAEKITSADEPLRPGQYRYLVSRSWDMAMNASVGAGGEARDLGVTFLVEDRRETWIPAGPTEECTQRAVRGEEYSWLVGDAATARKLGITPPEPERFELRIPCGDFADGGWQRPSTDFLASLPRDPDALYERLRRDTEGRGSDPDLEVLVYATDALRTGVVPADLRAALYRALAKVPGLEITERPANLDGREGVAFGITRGGERNDVIIDPATGQYIGARRIDVDGGNGIPAGTVTGYSSVTTPVVVDRLGATG